MAMNPEYEVRAILAARDWRRQDPDEVRVENRRTYDIHRCEATKGDTDAKHP